MTVPTDEILDWVEAPEVRDMLEDVPVLALAPLYSQEVQQRKDLVRTAIGVTLLERYDGEAALSAEEVIPLEDGLTRLGLFTGKVALDQAPSRKGVKHFVGQQIGSMFEYVAMHSDPYRMSRGAIAAGIVLGSVFGIGMVHNIDATSKPHSSKFDRDILDVVTDAGSIGAGLLVVEVGTLGAIAIGRDRLRQQAKQASLDKPSQANASKH